MRIFKTREESIDLIDKIKDLGFSYEYNWEKHRLYINDNNNEAVFYLRLPVHLMNPDDHEKEVNYIILLIQSGKSALGYFEGEENIDHKVFHAYMVRKKQGKSQIKYLKSKGKSRAGSRVRLANTVNFFENINERLQDYFNDYDIDRIALSCSKTLIPFLFNAKVACPFDKKDERILKVPTHVHLPNHEVLMNIHEYLMKGEVIFEDDKLETVREMIGD